MPRHIRWDDFAVDYPPTDGRPRGNLEQTVTVPSESPSTEDRIWQVREVGVVDPQTVEFVLRTDENIRWWKALRAYNDRGELFDSVETQDDVHLSRAIAVPAFSLTGGWLDIAKAKMFGVHTPMYRLYFDEMPHRGGTRYTFVWRYDDS